MTPGPGLIKRPHYWREESALKTAVSPCFRQRGNGSAETLVCNLYWPSIPNIHSCYFSPMGTQSSYGRQDQLGFNSGPHFLGASVLSIPRCPLLPTKRARLRLLKHSRAQPVLPQHPKHPLLFFFFYPMGTRNIYFSKLPSGSL